MSVTTIEVRTNGPALHEITDRIERHVAASGVRDGLLVAHVRHTSCSLLIQENADPDVQRDLLGFLDRLALRADAPGMEWIVHRSEGPDDMPAHMKAAVLPTNLSIPIAGGRTVLGTWQGIYLVEHRTRPHRREVVASVIGG